jgi:multidrug transporter EmrE-like cation transporter
MEPHDVASQLNAQKLMIGLGTWIILVSGVLLNAAAQLMLKAGATRAVEGWLSDGNLISNCLRVVFSPFIFGGLTCYVISVTLWIIVLSRVPVSMAYPMLSIGYIVNAVAAYFLFHEVLSFTQMIGIGVIIVGIFLVAR